MLQRRFWLLFVILVFDNPLAAADCGDAFEQDFHTAASRSHLSVHKITNPTTSNQILLVGVRDPKTDLGAFQSDTLAAVQGKGTFEEAVHIFAVKKRWQRILSASGHVTKLASTAIAVIAVGHSVVVLKEPTIKLIDHAFYFGVEAVSFLSSQAIHFLAANFKMNIDTRGSDYHSLKTRFTRKSVSLAREILNDHEHHREVVLLVPADIVDDTVRILFESDHFLIDDSP